MAPCPAVTQGGAFLSSVLQHLDCQGRTIGANGYQALADPASLASMALTALLTIFIALFGLRMILGQTPGVRDGVMAVVRIGVVLMIASSWPAFRTVIHDVVVDGPTEVGGMIAGSSGLPGNGDLAVRLQIADQSIVRLTTLGSGRNDLTSSAARTSEGVAETLERAPLAEDLTFGSARVVFLSSVIGAFGLVRLGAGVLLALAPLMAGALLFEIGHGLFAGWLRALVFTLVASIAVSLVFGVELALLEPWLASALQTRAARIITPDAPVELLVIVLGSAASLAGVVALTAWLAFSRWASTVVLKNIEAATARQGQPRPDVAATTSRGTMEGGRLTATVRAAAAVQRRSDTQIVTTAPMASASLLSSPTGRAGASLTSSSAPRRTRPRTSLAAAFRDRQS